MGKSVNLAVPLLGKWRTLFESRDIYDILGYLVQIPLQILFMLGSLCLALQITWRKIRPLQNVKPQKRQREQVDAESTRELTLKELQTFDGIKKDKIYVAVNHKVFDVTSAWQYFGPEGPDSSLAGREAGRALVTLSLPKDTSRIDNFSDFNSLQLDYLFELETQYRERYTFVGDLVERKQPKPLQTSCINLVRRSILTNKTRTAGFREDLVGQLPLPKIIQHQILDVYKTKNA